MSMRLVTTPWLTKNFAGVALDTGGLLRGAGWGGALPGLDRRILPHARPGITAPLRLRPAFNGLHGASFSSADSPNSHGAGNHFRRARSSEFARRRKSLSSRSIV